MYLKTSIFCNKKVEKVFLENTDETNCNIMGVHFSSHASFLEARTEILDNIYCGIYPTVEEVGQLECELDHTPEPNFIATPQLAFGF